MYVYIYIYETDVAVPLPEDRDLQGFLPLEKSFENLRFSNTALEGDVVTLNKLRAVRILHLGHCFAQYQINGSTPISIITEEKTGDNKFTSMSNGAGPSNELMKELEELSLNKDKQLDTSMSPVLSEAASSKSSVETDIEISTDKKIFQGILKPQGSLERNRDSLVNVAETSISEASSLPCPRKPRQNIAMQAIMRRAENEQKQVTFKNVSPVIVEEENDRKAKVVIVPPIISVANKPTPISEMPKVNEAANVSNILVQNRLSAIPLAPSVGQNQSASIQSQQRPTKLPPSIPMPAQVNQLAAKEQQPQQVAQQMLPQMHAGMTAQCSQQATTLGPVCYPNQSFNVQNPQFTKNFITNRPPLANAPRYQMQGQLNNNNQPQPVPAIPQGINGIHHTINQSRPLHQRMPQNVSHSPAQLLQQNIRLGSPAQQNIIPQSMSLQATNMGLQPGMSMEQQNHSMGLQQQQSIIQSNPRSNDMHSQLNGSSMANMSAMMSTLSVYEKDPQQQTLTTLTNSQSPTNTSNFQLNFNHFSQNQAFGQPLSQNQPSPSFYKKTSDAMDFPFPNQVNVAKNQPQQQQSAANSYMFCNYEPTEHFNLWKDTRPPQPPITWWGSANNTSVHMKDSIANDNTFSNWSDSSTLGNTASRVSLTPGKNYQSQQQNEQHGRHLMAGNNFEDSRLFEVNLSLSFRIQRSNNKR